MGFKSGVRLATGSLVRQVVFTSILFIGSNAWSQVQPGAITLSLEEYNQLLGQTQGGPGNCVGNLAQSMQQSMSGSYEAHNQRTNALMQAATTRFETLKNCRQELQQAWLDLEKAKLEHQQKVNEREAKVRRQEIAFKKAVLDMERECRTQANQEFAEYKKGVYSRQVIHDPSQLPGFNDKINGAHQGFFQACHRDPVNSQLVRLHGQEFQASILEIETEIKNSANFIESLELQLSRVQRNTLQNCEDAERLNAYNEALTQQMAQRALSLARSQSMFGAIQGIMGCIDGGVRAPTGGRNPDATGNRGSTSGF